MKKIKGALISVYYKDGLEQIVRKLAEDGVTIYSTGGTLSFIEGLGLKAVSVDSLTGYPSILGGRVKTLHPKVFGGILSRRDNPQDGEQTAQYGIPEIDAVIVGCDRVARNYDFQGRGDRAVGRSVRRILRDHHRTAVRHDARSAPPFRRLRVRRQFALRLGHLQLFQPQGTDRLVQTEFQ